MAAVLELGETKTLLSFNGFLLSLAKNNVPAALDINKTSNLSHIKESFSLISFLNIANGLVGFMVCQSSLSYFISKAD